MAKELGGSVEELMRGGALASTKLPLPRLAPELERARSRQEGHDARAGRRGIGRLHQLPSARSKAMSGGAVLVGEPAPPFTALAGDRESAERPRFNVRKWRIRDQRQVIWHRPRSGPLKRLDLPGVG